MNLQRNSVNFLWFSVLCSESCSVVSDSLQPPGLYSPWNSPGPEYSSVSSLCLLQGIFPTQESNQGLLHCRQILYQLSHKGSPFVLRKFFALLFIKYQSWLPSDGELILKDMMKCFESILKKCLHMLSIVLKAIFFFFFLPPGGSAQGVGMHA